MGSLELQAQQFPASRFFFEGAFNSPLDGFRDSFADGGAFAESGYSLSAGAFFPVHKDIRVGGMYSFGLNPADDSEVGIFSPFIPGLQVNIGNWTSHVLVAGMEVVKVFDSGLEFFGGPLGGFVAANSPEFEGRIGLLSARINSESGAGFVYGGQIGLMQPLADRWGIHFSLRYLTARPEAFSLRSPPISFGTLNIPSQSVEIDTRLSLLSVGLGVNYRLKK
jgi:hypothetical protein